MSGAYDGPQIVGMDLHRRRSVLVRMAADGRKLETARITNSPGELRRLIARAGKRPGWCWRLRMGGCATRRRMTGWGARTHLRPVAAGR